MSEAPSSIGSVPSAQWAGGPPQKYVPNDYDLSNIRDGGASSYICAEILSSGLCTYRDVDGLYDLEHRVVKCT